MADFDFTADELGAVDRIPRYNERPFNDDATSPAYNLWGFDNGGYLTLQMKQGRDTMLMGVAARRFASSASSSAILAAQEAASAKAERIAAQNAASDAYGSAQAAAAQAGAAAATYDAFDDRYLGAKAADPAKDNDGDALIVGALYFNTALASMRVWNGNAWQPQVPAAADYVPKTRQVLPGNGLTGGGDLSADRTLSLDFSTQAEAEAGASTTKPMSPLRVKQAIAAQSPVPGLVFISAQTVASAVAFVDFTGLSAAFDEYVFHFENVVPASGSPGLLLRTSADNGVNFDSGANTYSWSGFDTYNGSAAQTSGRGDSVLRVGGSYNGISPNVRDGGISGEVSVIRPGSSVEYTQFKSHFVHGVSNDTVPATGLVGGVRSSAAVVNAIRFLMSSGNITSGSFKLYGRRKS